MSLQDIFYDPSIIALVLERESVSESYLENNPYIQFRKDLASGYSIIYVKETDVDKVITNIDNYVTNLYPLVLGLIGTSELSAAGISQVQQQPFLNLRGSGVLLGFIDTGIDYTQSAFRYENGDSKIVSIWDQTIRSDNPPADYPYGTEYSNQELNQALKSPNPLEAVPHKDTVGHGTFLASLAGGRGPGEYIGAAPDAEIIAVKLRNARPFDREYFQIPSAQENAFSSDDFMMGIQYIVDKATSLRRPVAICISLGTNSGAHDGLLPLARYISRVSSIIGVTVCAGAGNEAQAGHHTHGILTKAGETQEIEIKVGNTFEDINIPVWNSASDRISVSIKSPTGEQIARMPARSGANYTNKLILERATVTVRYLFPIERGAQVSRITIFSATPGVWTITVHADVVLEGAYHAWLPITGFVDPATVFLRPTPNFTIVTPANADGIITCGAYNSRDKSLAAFSSQGPTRLSAIKPDLVAPGVDVSGIYPGGPGTMNGTSAAAAITTGACALLLQWGIVEKNDISIDSYRIRNYLVAGCERDPSVEYPNNQWGYGRLNLLNTFRSLRPY